MMCLNFTDICIITYKVVDYLRIIHSRSKSDTTHLLKKYVLDDRGYGYNAYERNQCQK